MQKFSSKGTSVNKNKPPAIFTKIDKHVGWNAGDVLFDIGCGKYPEVIASFLKPKKVIYIPTDPFNKTLKDNLKVLETFHRHGPANIVTISNVLNVIRERKERLKVLFLADSILKPGGICYITCYNSGRTGESNPGNYQVGKPIKYYLPLVKEVFSIAEIKYSMIIATK